MSRNLLFSTLVLASLLPSCESSQTDEARGVYTEAYSRLRYGQEGESKTFVEELDECRQVLRLIDSIPERFPHSDLAMEVVRGDLQIGEWSVRELRSERLPKLEELARIERDFLLSAEHLALKSAECRNLLLARIYIAKGNRELATVFLNQAIEEGESRSEVAKLFARLGDSEAVWALIERFPEDAKMLALLVLREWGAEALLESLDPWQDPKGVTDLLLQVADGLTLEEGDSALAVLRTAEAYLALLRRESELLNRSGWAVRLLHRHGAQGEAWSLLQRIENTVDDWAADGAHLHPRALMDLAEAAATIGAQERAIPFWREALCRYMEMAELHKDVELQAQMVRVALLLGQEASAKEWLAKIPEEVVDVGVWEGWLKDRAPDVPWKWRRGRHYYTLDSLISVGCSFAQQGAWPESFHCLQEARQLALAGRFSRADRSEGLERVGLEYLRQGYTKEAREVFLDWYRFQGSRRKSEALHLLEELSPFAGARWIDDLAADFGVSFRSESSEEPEVSSALEAAEVLLAWHEERRKDAKSFGTCSRYLHRF